MNEERYTPEEAANEASRVQKMVGPKGEETDYERAQEVLESKPQGIRQKLMSSFSPDKLDKAIYNKLLREEKDAQELKRREELGPKGRIKEDVEKSILDLFSLNERYNEAYKKHGEKGGKIYGLPVEQSGVLEDQAAPMEIGPFSSYPDATLSACESIDKFVKDRKLSEDSPIGRLEGSMFCFGTGIDQSGRMALDEADELRTSLVGLDEDYTVLDCIELTDSYLDSLNEEDLKAVELAAQEAMLLTKTIATQKARAYRHRTENLP